MRTGSLVWSTELDAIFGGIVVDPAKQSVIVVSGTGQGYRLDRHTGSILGVDAIERAFLVSRDGDMLVMQTKNTAVLVRPNGDKVTLYPFEVAKNNVVVSSALCGKLLVCSWLYGGATVYDAETGQLVSRLAEALWLAELTWRASSASLVAFGSIGDRGMAAPIIVDLGTCEGRYLYPRLPDQREFVRGLFCDEGRYALLENEYVWELESGSVRPLPL
jgi:hypothetical protein